MGIPQIDHKLELSERSSYKLHTRPKFFGVQFTWLTSPNTGCYPSLHGFDEKWVSPITIVTFQLQKHVPLNRDFERAFFRKGFQFYYFYETLISNGEFSSWMTNNLFNGLVLFGSYFVAPTAMLCCFLMKNILFPKTSRRLLANAPAKMMKGKGFLLFQLNLFQRDFFHFWGRVGLQKIHESLMISAQVSIIRRRMETSRRKADINYKQWYSTTVPYWSLGSH